MQRYLSIFFDCEKLAEEADYCIPKLDEPICLALRMTFFGSVGIVRLCGGGKLIYCPCLGFTAIITYALTHSLGVSGCLIYGSPLAKVVAGRVSFFATFIAIGICTAFTIFVIARSSCTIANVAVWVTIVVVSVAVNLSNKVADVTVCIADVIISVST